MIVENLEVIFLAELDDMNLNIINSNRVQSSEEPFCNPRIRKIIGKAVHFIILKRSEIRHHTLIRTLLGFTKEDYEKNVRSRNALFRKKVEMIEEGLKIIENFSVAKKIQGDLWILTKREWEQKFDKSYKKLHDKFSADLQTLKKRNLFRCSKNCSPSFYTSHCAIRNDKRCEMGHALVSISQSEKDDLIEDLVHDIEILEYVENPSEIVKQMNLRYRKKAVEVPEKPIFSSNINTVLIHSNLVVSSFMSHHINYIGGI